MACCPGGYATDRFKFSVDRNFLCPICADVLKDPVQCQNQHYFCKECIKKHLETNAKSCPICVQDLSEETLAEAPRILTDYLNGLIISCDHMDRGCTEEVPISRLKSHVRECDFRPIVCTNEKCGQTFNHKDLAGHVTGECEYRLVNCPNCDDIMIYKKFTKHACELSKDLNKMELEWSELKNVLGEMYNSQKEMCNSQKEMYNSQKEMGNSQKEMCNYQKEIYNSQKEMCNSQKEMCNYQKEVYNSQNEMCNSQKEMYNSQKEMYNSQKEMCSLLKEMSNAVKGLTHNLQTIVQASVQAPQQASSPNATTFSAIVIGGRNEKALSSVEILYPGSKIWTVLQPMQESRGSAASVLYGNDVIVTGGRSSDGVSDTIERLSLVSKPFASIPFPVKLPVNLCGHKTVVIKNCLYLVGGYNREKSLNAIYSILLHPSYSIELKYEMEQPICFHGLQAVGESLLIFGGTTTTLSANAVDTVLSYNTVNNKVCKMKSLPFPVCDVATVQWDDSVIIIGGTSPITMSLNTVIQYDVKASKIKMLPSMKYARSSCAVTIARNKVIVMGGFDWSERKHLNSGECFDLDSQVWEELPEMNECRSEATAIAFAGLC